MKPPRVAGYIRMSTDKQADSPARQREQIEGYAARKGWKVVVWYQDLGISGSRDDRPGMAEAIRDAGSAYDVLMVDEQSRLSRLRPMHFIRQVAGPLMDAGVEVHTVEGDGPMDWEDEIGGITNWLKTSRSHKEVTSLSRRTLTGQAEKARAGKRQGGRVPFAMRKGADGKLEPGDPKKVEAVRYLFEQYATGNRSLGGLARDMKDQEVPAPGERKWYRETVRTILKNPIYTGRLAWNQISYGRHYHYADGQAKVKAKQTHIRNDRADWVVTEKYCPAIVPAETFERVRQLLSTRTKCNARPEGGDFVFAGIIFCGNCGTMMSGNTRPGGMRVYNCNHYVRLGRTSGCTANRVQEKALLRTIATKLQAAFLHPDTVRALRAEALRQSEAGQSAARRKELERLVDKLTADVTRAEKRLVTIPDEMMAGAVEQTRELQSQLAVARIALEGLGTTDPVADLETELDAMKDRLHALREVLAEGDPKDVRIVVRDVVNRIVLTFEPVKLAKITRTKLVRGEIETQFGWDAALDQVSRLSRSGGRRRRSRTAGRS